MAKRLAAAGYRTLRVKRADFDVSFSPVESPSQYNISESSL
jgi:hypothetical protein